MTFLNPIALLLLLGIPVWIAFFVWRNRIRMAKLSQLGDFRLISALLPKISYSRRNWKSVLWLVAYSGLVIAIAQPVWGIDLDIVETQGVSVMVVLDVSASMLAQDIVPNRLERAKLGIRDLFNGLSGNEVGLIVFAGDAYLQFPLTTDSISATAFLNIVSTNSVSRQGTTIEDALRLAKESFGERSPRARIIILMTDGENHEGDPLREADIASQEGVAVYAIGYGDPEGVPIPILDANGNMAGYKTDEAGEIILSRLDEEILRSISERTGGIYQRASVSGEEIANLLERIRAVEAGDLGSRTERRRVERFGIFVALAVVALSAEMFVSETKVDA